MATSSQHPGIQLLGIDGQLREVRQTRTARIYSRPRSSTELDWLLMDPLEHDGPEGLHDRDERVGGQLFASSSRQK
jgi:hypothetical protein